jgi:hypothetical protein
MPNFSIQEKTFNIYFVSLFLIVVFGMAAFNYSVNAFGVFPMKTIAGYNDVRFVENARIYKTFLVKNRHIDGLLLGSSRIEESMRPLPAAWPNMQPYNMAMPGASIHELLRNLQHANAITPLKQVLIGVDFFMFSAFMEPVSDFSENYFAVDEAGKRKSSLYVLRTYANILLSADALEKSVSTIKDSEKHITPSHEDNGMTSIAAHMAAVKDNAALYKVFDSFEKTYFRKNGFWLNGPNATFTTAGKDGHSTYDDFRALLDYVYRNNISASFVIPPLHEYMLFGLDGIGLWPTYLQWKRDITAINEQVAAQYQQAPRPLWDFAVVNAMTREWLPEDPRLTAPKNGMHWFWDPAHARPAFGDEIQQRVFISKQQDIGTVLTQRNIEQHLQQQTAALAQAKQEDATIREHIKQKLQSLHVWQHIPPVAH